MEWKRDSTAPGESWPGRRALRDFYGGRPVLVTGANGFLGTNAVYALGALGARVTVLIRHACARAANFTGRVVRGDLRDPAAVRAAIEDQSIVFDFAGVSGAVQSNQDPAGYLDRECGPHLQIIKACAEAERPPVVTFCSTRLVYGRPQTLPVGEEHPLHPESMYAVHKITIEHYLNVFAHTHNLPFCVLRLSNPYGPNQPASTRGYGIINQFLALAAAGKAIRIFGDGRQRRDYIYVDDVITAFLIVAMEPKCHGQFFNVGGRESISIVDAVRGISKLAGGTPIEFEPWPQEYRSVETGDYVSDLSKIDSFVDLPPQTPFEVGFRESLAHYRGAGGSA